MVLICICTCLQVSTHVHHFACLRTLLPASHAAARLRTRLHAFAHVCTPSRAFSSLTIHMVLRLSPPSPPPSLGLTCHMCWFQVAVCAWHGVRCVQAARAAGAVYTDPLAAGGRSHEQALSSTNAAAAEGGREETKAAKFDAVTSFESSTGEGGDDDDDDDDDDEDGQRRVLEGDVVFVQDVM